MRKRDPEQPLKLPLLQPLDNDFCPCGGRRPWKLCHGGTPALASPKIENAAIDPTLLALAMNLVTVLKDAIESVKIDLDDFRNRASATLPSILRKEDVSRYASRHHFGASW